MIALERWISNSQLEQQNKTVFFLNHCGRQMENWQTLFSISDGRGIHVESQISKVKCTGLASKTVHTPRETTKPCSCNFINTHVYKSSNCTPNYPLEPVRLGFLQVPGALALFGFENKVSFNWQDIIKFKLTCMDKSQNMRVAYRIRQHRECSICVFYKVLAADWILNNRKEQN